MKCTEFVGLGQTLNQIVSTTGQNKSVGGLVGPLVRVDIRMAHAEPEHVVAVILEMLQVVGLFAVGIDPDLSEVYEQVPVNRS